MGKTALPSMNQGDLFTLTMHATDQDGDTVTNMQIFKHQDDSIININAITDPTRGVVLSDVYDEKSPNRYLDVSSIRIADINKDGESDLLIFYDVSDLSYIHGILGSESDMFGWDTTSLSNMLSLSDIDYKRQFEIFLAGKSSTVLGFAAGGDINDDGYADIAVRYTFGDLSKPYRGALILWGSDEWLETNSVRKEPAYSSHTKLGNDKKLAVGEYPHSFLGRYMDFGADFNGDGIDEVLVLVPDYSDIDEAWLYVVFGAQDIASGSGVTQYKGDNHLKISSMDKGAMLRMAGLRFEQNTHLLGVFDANSDYNADGYTELAISTQHDDYYLGDATASLFVLWGGEAATDALHMKATENNDLHFSNLDKSNALEIYTAKEDDDFTTNARIEELIAEYAAEGRTIGVGNFSSNTRKHGALLTTGHGGDINGDGYQDLIVGAPFAGAMVDNYGGGEVYIVWGLADGGFGADVTTNETTYNRLNIDDLGHQEGVVLKDVLTSDGFGIIFDGAHDLNLDGYDDIIINKVEDPLNKNTTNVGDSFYVVWGGPVDSFGEITQGKRVLDVLAAPDKVAIFRGAAGESDLAANPLQVMDINDDVFPDLVFPGSRDSESFARFYFGGSHLYDSRLRLSSDTAKDGIHTVRKVASDNALVGKTVDGVLYRASGQQEIMLDGFFAEGTGARTYQLTSDGGNSVASISADQSSILLSIDDLDASNTGTHAVLTATDQAADTAVWRFDFYHDG